MAFGRRSESRRIRASGPHGHPTRRDLLRGLARGAAGVGTIALWPGGCATTGAGAAWSWTPAERALLGGGPGDVMEIPAFGTAPAAVLRLRSREIDPGADLRDLERRMRATLEDSGGVGLAAPQVGIPVRFVLVTLGARGGTPRTVACANPRIVERSDDLQDDIEGCLSIPGACGFVRRNLRIRVAYDGGDRPEEIEAAGFDARIFQHEIDHLDGVLYTDRLVGGALGDSLRRPVRDELERRRAAGEAGDLLTMEQIADLAEFAAPLPP